MSIAFSQKPEVRLIWRWPGCLILCNVQCYINFFIWSLIVFCTAIRIYSYKWESWDPIDWFSPVTCFVSVAFRGLDFWIHVVVHFFVQWVGRRGDCSLSWCWWNCKPSLLKLYLLIDLYLRCMSISACQYSLYLWMKICGLIKQLNVFNPHFFLKKQIKLIFLQNCQKCISTILDFDWLLADEFVYFCSGKFYFLSTSIFRKYPSQTWYICS